MFSPPLYFIFNGFPSSIFFFLKAKEKKERAEYRLNEIGQKQTKNKREEKGTRGKQEESMKQTQEAVDQSICC